MKILCIRLSAIGDMVVTTPVYRALHQQLGAEVHVLTKRVPALVLKGNPHVHRLHDYEAPQVLEDLQAASFDLVIDLHCNLRSHKLRLQLGLPSIGYRKRNLEKKLLELGVDLLSPQHLVDRYFEALAPLGIHNDGEGLDYVLLAKDAVSDHREVRALLDVQQGRFAAVVLGATHATKRMPAALAASLLDELSVPAVLLGGPDVAVLGQEVMQRTAREDTINLCGIPPLRTSIAILARAAGVVAPDTGLMHVAAALRKPTVVVWGNTAPPYGMYPYLPKAALGLRRDAVVPNLSCQPCSRIGFEACPKRHFRCMSAQNPQTMAAEFAAIMEA